MKASGVKDRRSPVTHLLDLLYESAIIAATWFRDRPSASRYRRTCSQRDVREDRREGRGGDTGRPR
jgi:hypothetical protein